MLIGIRNHIRNFAIVKPANAPQSGSGLDNDQISYEELVSQSMMVSVSGIQVSYIPECQFLGARIFTSPSTVAWVIRQKYELAVLLYRQEKEWANLGVTLSRATMSTVDSQ